jgi:hypothetical protein
MPLGYLQAVGVFVLDLDSNFFQRLNLKLIDPLNMFVTFNASQSRIVRAIVFGQVY